MNVEALVWWSSTEEGDGEWAAISRNASRTGILMAVGKRLEVGDTLTLDFRVNPDDDAVQAEGKIVRIEENAEGPYTYWPHRVAIELTEPLSDVEPLLEEMAETYLEEEATEDAPPD